MNVTIPSHGLQLLEKKYELVKFNDKYYIELDNFEGSDGIVELSISLAAENDILRQRIKTLEKKIKILETCSNIRF
jgi:adenine C2-methylase RlmN of 23S rRNA A2503 and tRNA A37